jgi:ABC-type antimicrobial peptide transport system permease subunit
VGVSADYKVRSVMEAPTPYVHLAAAQRPAAYNTLMARTTGDTDVVLASIRRELLAMAPRLVFINQSTMERTVATALLPTRVGSMLAAGFGGLGTLLAAIGLYGVAAFAVSQRTKEIGIRVALGAERSDVLRMILRQGGALVMIGGLVGAGLAAVASAVLGGVLYGVGAADPVAWLSAIAVLIAAAVAAHLVPASGAMRIDPARTLRDG